ncbi:dynein light chain, putative [Plasmodium ovale wallikeri]|uniref:Dynein light chain, putative n=1 Tax=Plasmodium ovale wallikeri TaxID=864142 RepID=A0A1A8Z231_PLAOA|nr:dynein light chain, putative [Plasmodium ovale wallikeri]SBT37968.1 dynein light chain, putative [Plasmodium ovale wallikeri]
MDQAEAKKYSSRFEIKGICMNSENCEKISKISLKAIKENKFEKDIASQIKMKCENDELLNKDNINDENYLNCYNEHVSHPFENRHQWVMDRSCEVK